MIILNDNRFCEEIFYKAKNIEDIKKSPNNSTIIFDYNEKQLTLYKFCQQNNIDYGVNISSIEEFIFIINLNAKYALCDNLKTAKQLQKLADNYLTQTKIIIKSSINKLEKIALAQIDGIFVI